jgi:predicted ATPase
LNKGIVCIVSKKDTEQTVLKPISISGSIVKDEMRLLKNSFCSIIEPDSLFLPASRTGLLLLYREFFANKTDRELSFTVEENQIVENQKNFASLTQPIYEFLRFLQTYTQKDVRIKRFQKELDFFEEHIIEGRINVDKQGIFSYSSKDKKDKVPMYLASSMINEVAPLILAITSQNAYGRLIIDEVEASLHPQKQLELVRFFNRLNNNGMQLMISTHSDTFVSKLNNLYVLSEIAKINGEDIVRRFGMEKEDLVSPEKLFVYEFINQPNGKSVAKEIKPDKKTGYQFDLFTESALRLYEEAEQLGEMQ